MRAIRHPADGTRVFGILEYDLHCFRKYQPAI